MFTKKLIVNVIMGCKSCLFKKEFEMDLMCVDCCWKEICEQLSLLVAEFKSFERSVKEDNE